MTNANEETGEIPLSFTTVMTHPMLGSGLELGLTQLDRIEAELALLNEKLDTLLAGAVTVVQETGEIVDETLWPIWYSVANSVPGWKISYDAAEKWREKTGISEDLAERKAYALRGWWEGQSSTRKKGSPYHTWQGWCREDRKGPVGNEAQRQSGYEEAFRQKLASEKIGE